MPLIKHAKNRGPVRQNWKDAPLIVPRMEPPWVFPYCGICDLPVERFQMEVPVTDFRVGITGECCGKQQSRWITQAEVHRLRMTNEKLYLVVPTGRTQEIRGQKR